VPTLDLLDVYLIRWGIERVFQQITEVFSLRQLIASTPEGTIFQAALCLIWYNLIQVVRHYVAVGQSQPLAVEDVSTEMLFRDVRDQLTGLGLFATPDAAQDTARDLKNAHPGWWVTATMLG